MQAEDEIMLTKLESFESVRVGNFWLMKVLVEVKQNDDGGRRMEIV